MFSNLCKYKTALGIPNKGIHKHMFGFAIADLIMTIIGAFLLMLYIKKNYNIKISHSLTFAIILLIFILIGEWMHDIFCIYK